MVNAFEPPKMDGIVYIPGRPRQYRSDCKAGVFKIGESKIIGNELKLEILSFRTFEEQLFNYPYQSWLEIIFVDTVIQSYSLDTHRVKYSVEIANQKFTNSFCRPGIRTTN